MRTVRRVKQTEGFTPATESMVRPKAFSDRSFDVLRVATIELLQGRDNEARRQLFAVARPESEVARLRQVLEKPPPEKDVE